jgi:hypothetical protein
MTLERAASSASVIDVLDHVLDKGIVIDAWVRVSVVGIDLLTIEARVVVASIETYLSHGGRLADVGAHPATEPNCPAVTHRAASPSPQHGDTALGTTSSNQNRHQRVPKVERIASATRR